MNPDDLDVLTFGHFFMGYAPTVVPEPSLEDIPLSPIVLIAAIKKDGPKNAYSIITQPLNGRINLNQSVRIPWY